MIADVLQRAMSDTSGAESVMVEGAVGMLTKVVQHADTMAPAAVEALLPLLLRLLGRPEMSAIAQAACDCVRAFVKACGASIAQWFVLSLSFSLCVNRVIRANGRAAVAVARCTRSSARVLRCWPRPYPTRPACTSVP
jgi:hypothetical protein